METSVTTQTKADPYEVKKLYGADLLYAIDLANAVRSIGMFNKIKDLIPGVKTDSKECVLARSFNCNVNIQGASIEIDRLISSSDSTLRNEIKSEYGWYHGSEEPKPKDYIYPWFAYFPEKKYADALAGELGYKVIETVDPDTDADAYAVMLPKRVGRIAYEFDNSNLEMYVLGNQGI